MAHVAPPCQPHGCEDCASCRILSGQGKRSDLWTLNTGSLDLVPRLQRGEGRHLGLQRHWAGEGGLQLSLRAGQDQQVPRQLRDMRQGQTCHKLQVAATALRSIWHLSISREYLSMQGVSTFFLRAMHYPPKERIYCKPWKMRKILYGL